jgi:hypothetical protein
LNLNLDASADSSIARNFTGAVQISGPAEVHVAGWNHGEALVNGHAQLTDGRSARPTRRWWRTTSTWLDLEDNRVTVSRLEESSAEALYPEGWRRVRWRRVSKYRSVVEGGGVYLDFPAG